MGNHDEVEREKQLRTKISVAQSTDNLDLSNFDLTELEELPQSLVQLVELEGFWAHGNLLRGLPAGIGALRNLRTVALSGNRLEILDAEIGELVMLESLTLSGNHLRELPESIGNLKALKEIFLHGNQLEAIPETFSQLTMLGEAMLQWNFSCADNQLEELPPTLLTRPLLKAVYAYGNNIRRIPTEDLPSIAPGAPPLMQLWIEGNPLEPAALAEALPSLAALRTVGLDECQLAGLPDGALEQARPSHALRASSPRLRLFVNGASEISESSLRQNWQKWELGVASGRGVTLMGRLQDGQIQDVPRAGLLLIAFGSATGEPNWGRVLTRLRAELAETQSNLPGFDLMYVVDPSRACQAASTQKRSVDGILTEEDEALSPSLVQEGCTLERGRDSGGGVGGVGGFGHTGLVQGGDP
ncbi:hypothetical protein CYMTET_15119 [Cymbomonas tetramitiformis]|uniref:Uncharacterized protein n=1 Tax=Cymbomonas tetramitiformis TaxID=36881 RepID=A0AAE0GEM7_9CHLO|nr:hypothetical protein CYMTET_15119 [Cymbomonas tetramitiformis]